MFQNQTMRIKVSHFKVLFSLLIGQCERETWKKEKKKKKKGEQASKLEGEVFFSQGFHRASGNLSPNFTWLFEDNEVISNAYPLVLSILNRNQTSWNI